MPWRRLVAQASDNKLKKPRVYRSAIIAELRDALDQKRAQLAFLDQEHEQLRMRLSFLEQFYTTLDFINHLSGGQELRGLSDTERAVVAELASIGSAGTSASSSSAASGRGAASGRATPPRRAPGEASHKAQQPPAIPGWCEAVACEHDAFALARRVLSMPLVPGDGGLAKAQAEFSHLSREMALALAQLESGAGELRDGGLDTEQLLARIEAAACRHMQLTATLVLHHLGTFLELLAAGCDSSAAAGSVAQLERYRLVVRHLALSAAQKRRLAAGHAVAQELMEPLIREASRLHGARDRGGERSFGDLDAELLRCSRLQIVQRKDALVRLVYAFFTAGALSWPQLAKVHALLAPSFPVTSVLARAVVEQVEEEEAADSLHLGA